MSIPSWAERARDTPTAPALISATRTWTCAEVAAEVATRRPHDELVAISGACSVEALLDLIAAIDAGTPALMLHPRWTTRESDAIEARARSAPRGTLAIVATSGTTGVPKLALLSRRAFVAAAHASGAHLGTRADDRWLLSMTLAHVGGLGVVVRSLVQRTPIVVNETEHASIAIARAAQVTHVSLVPTMLARLLDRLEPFPESIRVALLGGAACPERVLARAIAARVPIHPTYGLTETCGQVATTRSPVTNVDDARALEPLPGVVLRVENGTIRVRSEAAMDGWLDAPSPFGADGFYDTGDLGALDDRGRVTIFSRRTDLVVTGGENVYPSEVEAVLERAPGVRAACVFGVPDDEWGQRVAAAIVVDVHAPSDAEIVAFARRELAAFKLPRAIARVDALAVGPSGKLDRRRTAAAAIARLVRS